MAEPLAENLPYVSHDLPGLGGRIKARPEHFAVEEIPLYEASGAGPHLYLTLRRLGLTTREVVDKLAARYGHPAAAVGYASLKDKDALTTQTFSLPVDLSEKEARAIAQDGPWELLAVGRHQNKLKVGHLLGNRFTIVLSGAEKGLPEARAIVERLKSVGVLNYFGEQRFGRGGRQRLSRPGYFEKLPPG